MINLIKSFCLCSFVLLFFVALIIAMFEVAVGCGGHYIDAQGVAHVNQCIFIGEQK